MKESFTNKLGLNKFNAARLRQINVICEEYAAEGYKLTLRQIYYQLVSKDIIPNIQSEYSKLSTLLKKGRMAGEVDWDIIEDRIRQPYIPYYVTGIEDAVNDTINQYRLDRMDDQSVYIEVWVEKDALSGVLRRITEQYHVRLMVNRGYSSCSAMYDAAKRIKHHDGNQECYILYLGDHDHDPSGLDMDRDIQDRLNEFQAMAHVKRIALTSAQVRHYKPPPNPAKFQDPRAATYIAQFGKTSWEVDALNPKTLHNLLKDEIEDLIDIKKFKERVAQEERDKNKLKGFLKHA